MLMKTVSKMALATVAFAVLHSALASRGAKQAAVRIVGQRRQDAGYRLFFVGQSLLTFSLLIAYGARMPEHTLYRIGGLGALLLRAGQAAGFVHLLAAMRPSGLARLAGLANLRAYRKGELVPPGPIAQGPEIGADGQLEVAGPFLWSRHPLNFSGIPIFWLTPHMTTRRLSFNLISTVYFMLGSLHEEARLKAAFGERYARYQDSGVPFYWPWGRLHRTGLAPCRSVYGDCVPEPAD
jgi:methanethiol S-methyltransferase